MKIHFEILKSRNLALPDQLRIIKHASRVRQWRITCLSSSSYHYHILQKVYKLSNMRPWANTMYAQGMQLRTACYYWTLHITPISGKCCLFVITKELQAVMTSNLVCDVFVIIKHLSVKFYAILLINYFMLKINIGLWFSSWKQNIKEKFY